MTITAFELMRRSDDELGTLFHHFNLALGRKRPFSKEWSDADWAVDNILSERSRRADLSRPG